MVHGFIRVCYSYLIYPCSQLWTFLIRLSLLQNLYIRRFKRSVMYQRWAQSSIIKRHHTRLLLSAGLLIPEHAFISRTAFLSNRTDSTLDCTVTSLHQPFPLYFPLSYVYPRHLYFYFTFFPLLLFPEPYSPSQSSRIFASKSLITVTFLCKHPFNVIKRSSLSAAVPAISVFSSVFILIKWLWWPSRTRTFRLG